MHPIRLVWEVVQLLRRRSSATSGYLLYPAQVATLLKVSRLEAALALRCAMHETDVVKRRDDGRFYYDTNPLRAVQRREPEAPR